jgi:hypothetical protein
LLSFGNASDKFRAYRVFDIFDDVTFRFVAEYTLSQPVIKRTETSSIESNFVASLFSAIQDYIESDSSVTVTCEEMRVTIAVRERSSGLQKALRHQILRTLDGVEWSWNKQGLGFLSCSFYGRKESDDGYGVPRNCYLNDAYPNSMTSRNNLGCPSLWNRFRVRDHILIALSGPVRGKSWPIHICYFHGILSEKQLEEHFAKPRDANARNLKALLEELAGLLSNATNSYRKFLELAPVQDTYNIDLARQRLKKLEGW